MTYFARFNKSGKTTLFPEAASLFKEFSSAVDAVWTKDEEHEAFGEQYYKDTMSLLIIRKDLRKAVLNADFYNGGYLANIVDYTLAVLAHHVIEEWGGLDCFKLESIWRSQSAGDELISVLLHIAEKVLREIEQQSFDNGVSNVTQWCKRAACWEQVTAAFSSRNLLDSLRSKYCVAKSANFSGEPVSALVAVRKYSKWRDAFYFSAEQKKYPSRYRKALDDAVRQRMSTLEQATVALKALEELRARGFEK